MTTRDDYWENSHHPLCVKYISGDDLPCICDLLDEHATEVRADEQERMDFCCPPADKIRSDALADLRAKVEGLEEHIVERGELYVRRADVLALIEEVQR
jgi:hypothetical protein